MRTTTIPDGLPILSRGRHRNARRGACFMELASVLAGERWSDHPSCTHPLLSQLARQVNDGTTDEGRRLLTTLIPSVVGRRGDEWTPLTVSVAVATAQILDLPESTQRVLAAGLMRAIQLSDGEPELADCRRRAEAALEQVPGAVAWVQRLKIRDRVSRKTYAERCAPTLVRCTVEGVLIFGGRESDRRLRELLEAGIAATAAPQPVQPRSRPLPAI